MNDTLFDRVYGNGSDATTQKTQEAVQAEQEKRDRLLGAKYESVRDGRTADAYSALLNGTGPGRASSDALERDMADLSGIELLGLYGREAGTDYLADVARAEEQVYLDSNINRDLGHTVADTTKDILGGVLTSALGAAHLGSMASPIPGASDITGALLTGTEELLQENKSTYAKAKDRMYQAETAARQRDREYLGGGGLDEALDAAATWFNNPAHAAETISSGIGSLIFGAGAGGLATKGVSAIAKNRLKSSIAKEAAAVKAAGKGGVASKAEALAIAESRGMTGAQAEAFALRQVAVKAELASAEPAVLDKLANQILKAKTAADEGTIIGYVKDVFPAVFANSSAEAGNNANQAYDTIMGYTHEQLMAGSTEYRKRITLGESPEQAKEALALQGAQVTAAKTLPSHIASNFMMGKFEKNPLGQMTNKNIAGNMFKEGAQEFVEEGTGAYFINQAERDYADNTKDPMEGVIGQATEGALAGMGTAGAIKSPNVAVNAAIGTGKAIANPVINAVQNKAEDKRTSKEEEALEQATSGSIATIDNAVQTYARNQINNINADESLTPEEKTAKIADVEAKVTTFAENVANPVTKDSLVNEFGMSQKAVDELFPDDTPFSLVRAAKVIDDALSNPSEDSELERDDIISVSNAINPLVDKITKGLISGDEFIQMFPEGEDFTQELADAFGSLNEELVQSPAVQNLINKHMEFLANSTVPENLSKDAPVDDVTLTHLVNKAEAAPETMTSDQIDIVLHHAKNSGKYSPEQIKSMEVVKGMIKAAEETISGLKDAGKLTPIGLVSENVHTLDAADQRDDKTSFKEHFNNIQKAIKEGNIEDAKAYADNLSTFVYHMINKRNSVELSKELGKGQRVQYTGYTPDGTPFIVEDGAYYNPKNSKKSDAFYNALNAEAEFLTKAYNEVAKAYPELELQELDGKSVNREVVEIADEVLSQEDAKKLIESRKAKTTEPQETTNTNEDLDSVIDEALDQVDNNTEPEIESTTEDTDTVIKPEPEPEPKSKNSTDVEDSTKENNSPVAKAKKTKAEKPKEVSYEELVNDTNDTTNDLDAFGLTTDEYGAITYNEDAVIYDSFDNYNPFEDDDIILAHVESNTENENSRKYKPIPASVFLEKGKKEGTKTVYKPAEKIGNVVFFYDPNATKEAAGIIPKTGEVYINTGLINERSNLESLAKRYLPGVLKEIKMTPSQFADLFHNDKTGFDVAGAATFISNFLAAKRKAMVEGKYQFGKNNNLASSNGNNFMDMELFAKSLTKERHQKFDEFSKKNYLTNNTKLIGDHKELGLNRANKLIANMWKSLRTASRFAMSLAPVKMFTSVLGSNADPNTEKYATTRFYKNKVAKAYKEYLNDVIPALKAQLNKNLNNKLSNKVSKGKTLIDTLKDPNSEAHAYANMQGLNIVEPDGKGGYKYNDQFIELALLATMQEFINRETSFSETDVEEMAKALGTDSSNVSEAVAESLVTGNIAADFHGRLAQKISLYWGLKSGKDSSIGVVKGIPSAIAGDIMESLSTYRYRIGNSNEHHGFFQTSYVEVPFSLDDKVALFNDRKTKLEREGKTEEANKLDFSKFSPNKKVKIISYGPIPDNVADVSKIPSVIDDVMLRAKPNGYKVGTPFEVGNKTKDGENLTKKNKEAIQSLNNTPYQPVGETITFVDTLGVDAINDIIYPHTTGDTRKFNVVSRQSAKSQRSGLTTAINKAKDLIETYTKEGLVKNLEDLKVFFNNTMTTERRIHQAHPGPAGVSASRAFFTATNTVADLSENSDNLKFYKLAIAQGLGTNTGKLTEKSALEHYENLVVELDPLLTAIHKMNTAAMEGDTDTAKKLSKEVKSLLDGHIKEGTIDASMVAIHNLIELARFVNSDEKARKNFSTNIFIEIDGTTSGPALGALAFGTNLMDPDFIATLESGGILIDPDHTDKSYNELVENGEISDNYQRLANRMAESSNIFSEFDLTGSDQAPIEQRSKFTMTKLFQHFNGELEENNGIFKATRNFVKNLLTVLVYGSGNAGVASNYVSDIVKNAYQKINLGATQWWEEDQAPNDDYGRFFFPNDSKKAAREKTLEMFRALNQSMRFYYEYNEQIKDYEVKERDSAKNPFPETHAEMMKTPASFWRQYRFNSDDVSSMVNFLTYGFADPARRIAENVMTKEVMDGLRAISAMSNIISSSYVALVESEKNKLLKNKEEAQKQRIAEGKPRTWAKSDYLTVEEINAIENNVKAKLRIKTIGGLNNISLAKQGRVTKNASFGRSMDDSYGRESSLDSLSVLGAASIPFANIGFGEAAITQEVAAARGESKGSFAATNVFDGINISPFEAEDFGKQVNAAIKTAVVEKNILKEYVNAAIRIYENIDAITEGMTPTELKELASQLLSSAELSKGNKDVTRADIVNSLRKTINNAQEHAAKVEASHRMLLETEVTYQNYNGLEGTGSKQEGKYKYGTPEWEKRYHEIRLQETEAIQPLPLPKSTSGRDLPLAYNGKPYIVPSDSRLNQRTKQEVTFNGVSYGSIAEAIAKGLKRSGLEGKDYRNAFVNMLKNLIKSNPSLYDEVLALGERQIKFTSDDGKKGNNNFYANMLNLAKREILSENPVAALNAKDDAKRNNEDGARFTSTDITLRGLNHRQAVDALAEANINVEPNSVADRIIRQAVKDKRIQEMEIHVGNMEELLIEHNIDVTYFDEGSLNGIYFTKNGVPTILISNKATAETVAHELIHAKTADAIRIRMTQPDADLSEHLRISKTAGEHVGRAIDDLGTQMDRFMARVSEMINKNPTGSIPKGVMDIFSQIRAYEDAGERFKAVMEFASWATTNNDVEQFLKGITRNVNDNFWGAELAKANKLLGYIVKAITYAMGIDMSNPHFKNLHERISYNVFTITGSRNNPTDPLGKSNGDVVLAHSTNPNNKGETNNIINSMGNLARNVVSSRREGLSKEKDVLFKRSLEQNAYDVSELMSKTMALSRMDLNPDERVAYTSLVTAMTVDATLGSDVMLYAQELFDVATENIKVEDFLENPNDHEDSIDYQRAKDKYDALFAGVGQKSVFGVPMNLPNFIALVTINPEYSNLLKNIDIPKAKGKGSLDSKLRAIANNTADSLIRSSARGNRKAKTVGDALSFVVEAFDASLVERANALTVLEDGYTTLKDKLNDYAVTLIDTAGNKTENIGKNLKNTSTTKLGKAAGSAIELVGKTISDKDGDATKLGLEMIANKEGLANVFRTLITDFVGLSKQNKPVYHMIKKIKAFIQRARQTAIENIPKQLSDKFKERLSKEDWAILHRTIGKADIASLLKTMPYAQAISALSNDTNLNHAISKLEGSLSQIDTKRWKRINKKADQLAQYLVDGTVGNNLLVNASQIARLQGENTNAPSRAFTQKEINDLDSLISLKAFALQSKYEKDRVRHLLKTEKEGMETVIKYMHAMAQTEASKSLKGSAGKVNARKGYLPFIGENDKAIIVIDDSHAGKYKRMGYVRIGDYHGSKADPNYGKSRGYYFLNAPSNAPFHQGIVQNVKSTFSGADDLTGASTNPIGGLIRDRAQVKRIHSRMQADPEYAKKEGLIPLYYKENSKIPYAYERSLNPEMMDKLNPNYNLAEQIGVWKGRQIEESMAEEANRALVDASFDMYDEAVKNDYADQFVNVMDPEVIKNDPVLKDALSLMPTALKEYINETYDGKFMVRRSMLEDTFGYRASMASDLWNGVSRISEPVRNTIRDAIELILGDGAYRKVMRAQTVLQNLVQDARTLIVIKSVIVPAVNIAANVLQNVARGIPVTDIYKYYKRSFNEINYYVKENQRLQGLELDYEVAKQTDPAKAKEIHNKMEAIRESFDRLAIKPLIDAGEFTSVSMSQVYNDYTDLSTGSVDSLVEGWVDKLPKGIRTIGKYAIVSSDTAMYEAMQKLTDYGDFVSKYALYEHLTKKKGVSQEDALDAVTDEYVNYDKLPGRFRHAAENNGLMWFWNWKIRTTKIGISMLRNNPIGSMFAMNMGDLILPFKAGLPFEDSVLGRALGHGSLLRSTGPSMFFGAWKINPWYGLYNSL